MEASCLFRSDSSLPKPNIFLDYLSQFQSENENIENPGSGVVWFGFPFHLAETGTGTLCIYGGVCFSLIAEKEETVVPIKEKNAGALGQPSVVYFYF